MIVEARRHDADQDQQELATEFANAPVYQHVTVRGATDIGNSTMNDSTNFQDIKKGMSLEPLFNPRSIAVVGASDDVGKVGGRTLASLISNEYKGKLYAVNPSRDSVQGLPAYRSLEQIGAAVDLAVLCVPGVDVEAAVAAAGKAGVKAVIVYASGFAELNDEGALRQKRLAEHAVSMGMVMVGPNCLGVMNGVSGMIASSTIMVEGKGLLRPGSQAFISQSGAIGTYWLDMVLRQGFGISKWISTGNEADVNLARSLEYLVDDEQTSSIGLYVEGIRDGAGLRHALQRANERRKPVMVLKSGRSAVGAQSVASHTGALAGEDALTRSAFEQFGACQVDSLAEMLEVTRIFDAHQQFPSGRRTAIVSISGGICALLADAAARADLDIPPLPDAVASQLKEFFPDYAKLGNPIDLTDRVIREDDMLARTLEIVMASKAFDIILVFVAGRSAEIISKYAGGLKRVMKSWNGAHAIVWKAADAATLADLKDNRIAVFEEIPNAVGALGKALTLARHWEQQAAQPTAFAAFDSASRVSIRPHLTEHASKTLLMQRMGLPCPSGALLKTEAELPSLIAGLQAPFVVKLQSPDMLHKSGGGGIELGLNDAQTVASAVRRMISLARERGLQFEGVLVEEMKRIEFEFLVGLRIDAVFGPFLVLGRGGIAVEVDPDIVRRFLPLTADDIEGMFNSLRTKRLLQGFRGGRAAPLRQLAELIAALAELFMRDAEITEIEINPLAVDRDGVILALDAAVQLSSSPASLALEPSGIHQ